MTKRMRLRLFVLSILLIIFLGIYFLLSLGKDFFYESNLLLNSAHLVALNEQSVNSFINDAKSEPYLFYKFSDSQSKALSNVIKNSGGASLEVEISLEASNNAKMLLSLGFLYSDDFVSSHRLKPTIPQRPVASVYASGQRGSRLSLSLCMDVNKKMPSGFYVFGEDNFRLVSAKFGIPIIGYDRSLSVPLYAFGPEGKGLCTGGVDFSGAEKAFSAAKNTVLPKLQFILSKDAKTKVDFSYGEEDFYLLPSPSGKPSIMQSAIFKTPFSVLTFSSDAQDVQSVLMIANPIGSYGIDSKGWIIEPLETDLGLIQHWPLSTWRTKELELFRWHLFPQVLFFDFASYDIQDRFFTRMAYFVEKKEYAGTLVDDDFVLSNHGYNAHDYKAEDMARFFTAVVLSDFKLFNEELWLREILLHNGIIQRNEDGTYRAGEGAVISICRQSTLALRSTFIRHESWHGVYFVDWEFRDLVRNVYNNFDPISLEFLKQFWQSQSNLQYDRNNEYLMQNEFMAYLMQQNTNLTQTYFMSRASLDSVEEALPELSEYVKETDALPFLEAAKVLNDWVFKKWGLAAGRVYLIGEEDNTK